MYKPTGAGDKFPAKRAVGAAPAPLRPAAPTEMLSVTLPALSVSTYI